MIFRNFFLRKQLKDSGSGKAEAKQFAKLSEQLSNGILKLDPNAKNDIAQQIGFKPAHVHRQRRLELAGAFAFVLIVSLVSQTASPGSPLYALKRGTEEVILKIKPGFKDELVDRRKHELEDLKRENAREDSINRAEVDYESSLDRSGRHGGDDRGSNDSNSGSSNVETSEQPDSGSSGSGSSGSDSDSSGSGSSGRDHFVDD